ncbi:hypothetical protein N7527_010564 [Penicillium freii]|nr:hypothetical protein N7527_010564 [Penicillium freii]
MQGFLLVALGLMPVPLFDVTLLSSFSVIEYKTIPTLIANILTSIMAPEITSWNDLTKVWEQCNDETGEIQTSFALFDSNENFYYGMLESPKAEITFAQVTNTLESVPDEEIFTRWPALVGTIEKRSFIAALGSLSDPPSSYTWISPQRPDSPQHSGEKRGHAYFD